MMILAVLIELVGIATVATGIGLEIAYGGQLHLIIITIGSCLLAVGAVLFGKFLKIRR